MNPPRIGYVVFKGQPEAPGFPIGVFADETAFRTRVAAILRGKTVEYTHHTCLTIAPIERVREFYLGNP